MKKTILGLIFLVHGANAHFDSDTVPYSTTGKEIDSMKIVKELPKDLGLAKIGVKKGDIILEVDGKQVTSRYSGFEAYVAKNPKTVTVLRNKKQMILGSDL